MSFAARRLATRSLAIRRPLPIRRNYDTETDHDAHWDLENYPEVPDISHQRRPPLGWDDMQERRNFGEPLHEQYELYSMWGPDVPPVPPQTALRHFTYVALGFITFGLFTKYALLPEVPVVRREYPFGGLSRELGGADDNTARPEVEDSEE